MRTLILLLAAAAIPAAAADNLLAGARWRLWSPRPDIAPEGVVDGAKLQLRARNFAAFGKWIAVVPATGGTAYRFTAPFRTENVSSEDVSVAALLSWCKDSEGKTPLQRDYAGSAPKTFIAPAGTRSVSVELLLRWSDGGSVVWTDPALAAVEKPKPRLARIVTTHMTPSSPPTVEGNVDLMAKIIDKAAAHKPDLVVLSENFVDRGVSRPLRETSQPVPGPATEVLASKAREHRTWIVTTLHEVEQDLFYNTAVVIDREGRIAGKYRKIHLATTEGENGITPGSDYAVFDTDFGRIGVLTCWDNWFVESARILRLKGAELLVLPIAGDGVPGHWDVISRARAIDNGVYLVSSNTVGESSSRIVAPTGKVLAETVDKFGLAFAEVDLDAVERVRWLSVGAADGDPRDLYISERRPDTYGALARDRNGLTLTTEFEGGNLETSEILSNSHVRAKVRAESDQNRRNRQPSWFYFRLDGVAGREITVDLTGFEGEYNFKPTNGQWAGRMRPFFSYDNRNWQTFESTEWNAAEVRLRPKLKPASDRVWIARIPPYTNRHLDALLKDIESSTFVTRTSVGQTPQGRPMHLLTITDPAQPAAGKKVIWLMARQHSWEQGTSWVAEGAIRYLLSKDASVLRERFIFKVLPMCDPDGVARGGVRFNANGYDLNRNWDAVDPALMPEIAAQRKAILDWVDAGNRIDLFLAMHNDESDDYIQGPLTRGGPKVRELGERFWKLLDAATPFDSPKGPRDMPATTTAGMKGRMTVYQGLFHDRKIPAFLMELKTEPLPKLGREATVADRMDFGSALVRAMAAAVEGS